MLSNLFLLLLCDFFLAAAERAVAYYAVTVLAQVLLEAGHAQAVIGVKWFVEVGCFLLLRHGIHAVDAGFFESFSIRDARVLQGAAVACDGACLLFPFSQDCIFSSGNGRFVGAEGYIVSAGGDSPQVVLSTDALGGEVALLALAALFTESGCARALDLVC